MRNRIYLVTRQVIECSLSQDDSFQLRKMYTERMSGIGVDVIFVNNPHTECMKNVYDSLVIDVREIAAIISPSDGDSI